MVNVEPFIFQKVTAFKERLQMVDKINEIVDAVNTSLLSPDEIRQMIENELSDYYDKAEIDQMFSTIDFSPYYTKTEVNAIISRVDGDVDAVEGRLNTAEGDIATLETDKQDVLTAGKNIDINNNVISLTDWEVVPIDDWPKLFEKNGNVYTANDTFIVELFGRGQDNNLLGFLHTSLLFIKGSEYYAYVSLPIVPYSVYAGKEGLCSCDFNLEFVTKAPWGGINVIGHRYRYQLLNYSSSRPYYTIQVGNGDSTEIIPSGARKETNIDFSSTNGIQVIIYRRK